MSFRYVNTREPLEFEWVTDDPADLPTGAEVRVYVLVLGERHYWNGTDFTATDATITGTFSNGLWVGEFAYGPECLNKEVTFEARPLGNHTDAWIVESRFITQPPEKEQQVFKPVAKTIDGFQLKRQ